MITLYGFGAGFGLPEISPFVTKTEVQLKMAGIAYRKEKAKPPASPKGQLPYIVDEAETIADFHLHPCASRSQIRFRLRRPAQPAGARAGLGLRADDRAPCLLGAGRRALGRWRQFCQGAVAFLRRGAGASARKDARGRPVPGGRELPAQRPRPPRAGRGRRSRRSLAVCVVGPAWRQAVPDGRNAMRHGRHRLRRARRNFDAVLRVSAASAYRAVRQPHRLCRPDDASVLSGIRLGAAAAEPPSCDPPKRAGPSMRPAPLRVRRYAHRARQAPAPRRRRRTFAGCAAGSWCPTPKSGTG